jgi:hypothetical protein
VYAPWRLAPAFVIMGLCNVLYVCPVRSGDMNTEKKGCGGTAKIYLVQAFEK